MASTVIRWILSVALLFGVYTETGPWTTLLLAFVLIYIETSKGLQQWAKRILEEKKKR